MKKIMLSISGIFLLLNLFSCFGKRHSERINITVSESEDIYKITAEYNERKDDDIEHYLDKQFSQTGKNISFSNTRIDGDLTLDDRTTFYIRKEPGLLRIKFDKDKNSRKSYAVIKKIGEGLKEVLKD